MNTWIMNSLWMTGENDVWNRKENFAAAKTKLVFSTCTTCTISRKNFYVFVVHI